MTTIDGRENSDDDDQRCLAPIAGPGGFDVPDDLPMEVSYEAGKLELAYATDSIDLVLNDDFVRRMLTTKYEHWRYEEEWRIFVELGSRKPEGSLYFCEFDEALELKEIVLGPRCELPAERLTQILDVAAPGAIVRRSRISATKFEVVEQNDILGLHRNAV